jgi:hypothetical protein
MKSLRGKRFASARAALTIPACALPWFVALAGSPDFEEHFDTNVLNANLEDADNAFIIEAASIHRTAAVAGRHYVRTVGSDYMSEDFVAEVSLSIGRDTIVDGVLFFGIGPGVPECDNYCEPSHGIVMRMHAFSGLATGQIHAGVFRNGPFDPVEASAFYFLSTNGGFHRASISKQGATITFAFDENCDGTFKPDATYTLTNVFALAPWLSSTNSRIFFGAGNTVDVFDDLLVYSELRVTSEPAPLTENSGSANINVERLRGVDQPATIRYGVTGGTATPGVDFVLTNGVLEFAAGAANLTIPLTIIDDALVEGPETILLGLTNSATGWSAHRQLTILDDDTGIELESATYTVSEDAGQVVLGVRRRDDSPDPATVEFTTVDGTAKAGEDYATSAGTLTFAPGETRKQIVVPIIDDGIREIAETFVVKLTNAAGGSSLGTVSEATVTIPMNDPATLLVWQNSPSPTPPYLSWATAATNIQDAVDIAMPGETVLVTNGVYAVGQRDVGGGPSRVTVSNAIMLLSVNGPSATVIDGGGGVRCVYLASGGSLSGFTLTNGFAAGGGGLLCESASAVVSNSALVGNISRGLNVGGGGAFGGTLYRCTLADNTALGVSLPMRQGVGGVGGGAANCTLNNCTLSGNTAQWHEGIFASPGKGGGAAYCTLNNCTLTANSATDRDSFGVGGGAYSSTLYNCTVTGNYGGGASASSTLYNCVLTGNEGGSDGVFYNCTVVDNNGGVTGAAFNSIIYYNSGGNYRYPQPELGEYWLMELNYCCTTPLPTNGVGSITGPPLFMDIAAGDFRLWEGSPCIDAGTNLLGFAATRWDPNTGEQFLSYAHDATDILGNTRFFDGDWDGQVAWDIGAYEFDSFTPPRFAVHPQLTDEGWKLSITGSPGRWARLQRSGNLKDWQDIWSGWMGPEGVQQVNDRVSSDEGQPVMFYRVVVP